MLDPYAHWFWFPFDFWFPSAVLVIFVSLVISIRLARFLYTLSYLLTDTTVFLRFYPFYNIRKSVIPRKRK